MRRPFEPTIVIISELAGPVADRIREVQRRLDPRMANELPPHVTIAGSSGMGPLPASTTMAELRDALEPIARETPPMSLALGSPIQFMQTRLVVLPMDPHGPLRALHERIKTSGLRYAPPRFAFTPHVTLNFYRELPPAELRAALAVRIEEPVLIDRIAVFRTTSMSQTELLLELRLTGSPSPLSS